MSKRVRTSLRASNKGRSLRPKAVLSRRSLLPGEVAAAAPLDDDAAGPRSRPVDDDAAGPRSRPVDDNAPPSITQRVTMPDAPSSLGSAESAPTDPADSPVPEANEAFTAPAEESIATSEPEAPSEVTGESLADAIRAASASSEIEEPVAPVAADAPEPAASRDPEAAAPVGGDPVEANAAPEEKSLESAETSERPSGPDAVQATAVEEDDAAEEQASRPRKEEDLDSSGVSAEFFRDDEASLAPTIEDVPEEPAMRVVLSPATVARRARFRRAVAGVIAFAGVISLAVIGKSIAAPRKHAAVVMTVVAPAAPIPPLEPPKSEPAAKTDPPPAPEPAAEDKKADDAKTEAKSDEAAPGDDKKADDKKADEQKADDKHADDAKTDANDKAEPAGEPDLAAAKKLQQETLSLLNRGRSKDAIDKAREAIAADPTDAIAYLYLGSALQDSGHWKDGVEAYSECVRHATKGSVNECRIMGGHK
jgi:hypothetical protein